MSAQPVPITSVGPVASATMLFRESGLLHVTAIVKASFAFGAPMTVTAPEPIHPREVHRMNNPARSISATSDLVPKLPGADVLLLAQAYAPGGSATTVRARLSVGRGDAVLLDKSVLVVGDQKGSDIKPFRSIPLVFERTYGGPGFRDNPLGTGALSGDPTPNLFDPQAGPNGPRMAVGFAPISRSWPTRSGLIAAEVRAGLDKPIAEIPAGFDLRYFHAAPPDQRVSHLIGDEWIVLENVHPQYPVVQLSLPGAQAMVRVAGIPNSAPRVFSLRADTLRIDVEAERCTLVWRNSFRVNEADLGVLSLAAGISLSNAPIPWPELSPRTPAILSQGQSPVPAGTEGTLILEDHPGATASLGTTMEVSDDDILSVRVHEDAPNFGSTAVLSSAQPPATAPLPAFYPAPTQITNAPPAVTFKGTLDLSPGAGAGPVMPFAGGKAAPPAADERAPAPIPGSPWDPHALPPEEAPTFEVGDLAGTLTSPTGPAGSGRPPEK